MFCGYLAITKQLCPPHQQNLNCDRLSTKKGSALYVVRYDAIVAVGLQARQQQALCYALNLAALKLGEVHEVQQCF